MTSLCKIGDGQTKKTKCWFCKEENVRQKPQIDWDFLVDTASEINFKLLLKETWKDNTRGQLGYFCGHKLETADTVNGWMDSWKASSVEACDFWNYAGGLSCLP